MLQAWVCVFSQVQGPVCAYPACTENVHSDCLLRRLLGNRLLAWKCSLLCDIHRALGLGVERPPVAQLNWVVINLAKTKIVRDCERAIPETFAPEECVPFFHRSASDRHRSFTDFSAIKKEHLCKRSLIPYYITLCWWAALDSNQRPLACRAIWGIYLA